METNNNESLTDTSYLERNKSWLLPLIATLLICITDFTIIELLEADPLLPNWIYLPIITLGFIYSGFNLIMCNTLSATIVIYLVKIFIMFTIAYLLADLISKLIR